MTTVKGYTDIAQSKKLAKLLSLDSADTIWDLTNPDLPTIRAIPYEDSDYNSKYLNIIPAWSLAALLEQIPGEMCDDEGNSAWLSIYKEDNSYQLVYSSLQDDFNDIETDVHEHFVDACVEMIELLHEQNLL